MAQHSSDFEFSASRSFGDQADGEGSEEGSEEHQEEVAKKTQVELLELHEPSVAQVRQVLREMSFQRVQVSVSGPDEGRLCTESSKESSSVCAPAFVDGGAALLLQHCHLHSLPCVVTVSAARSTVPSSLYL